MACNDRQCIYNVMQHTKRGEYEGEVNFELFNLIYYSFFWALKWHLIYQNWSRHWNFTIEKGSKYLIVFFVIFWKYSFIAIKPTATKFPPFDVLHHKYFKVARNPFSCNILSLILLITGGLGLLSVITRCCQHPQWNKITQYDLVISCLEQLATWRDEWEQGFLFNWWVYIPLNLIYLLRLEAQFLSCFQESKSVRITTSSNAWVNERNWFLLYLASYPYLCKVVP